MSRSPWVIHFTLVATEIADNHLEVKGCQTIAMAFFNGITYLARQIGQDLIALSKGSRNRIIVVFFNMLLVWLSNAL